jgi:peptidoglycan/xylan/chitin deacetylase (PgdA/CDA1 family)
MYHEIPDVEARARYFSVPSDRFARHLDLLRALGVRVLALETARREPAGTAVALTFDDGHRTHYQHAFPQLAERGMTATFFVTTSWVGTHEYATWSQLREMSEAGMAIQSHTVTHPFLSELPRHAVERELRESRDEIEQRMGSPCVTLALPGGDVPRHWNADDYRRVGYDCVATSRPGPNADAGVDATPFVRRYTVRRETSDERLRRQALASESAYAIEGLRQAALGALRTALGPTRYARWRRRVLHLVARS